MKNLIILPSYNEIKNIKAMLKALHLSCPKEHILVVDDNSPDGTAKLVKKIQGEKENIFLLEREKKEGLGPAYIAAFHWAKNNTYQKIVTMDCDFSHSPEEVPKLLALLDKNNLVIGSRYIDGIRIINWSFRRLLLSYLASYYVRFITGLPVYDPTGGFNAYSAPALELLCKHKISAKGYAFQAEVKYLLWQKNMSLVEHPITFYERQKGRSKMSQNIIFEAVWKILWLKLKVFFKSP